MNRHGGGYTIIEVLIFLAVSSALLVAAVITIGGQQRKAQFVQAMRDLEGTVRDVINDVGTGLYKNPRDYTCVVINGLGNPNVVPTFQSATGDTTGRNIQCIFLGKVMHFFPDTPTNAINLYDVVGRRLNSSGAEVVSIEETNPVTVTQNKTTLTQAESTSTLAVQWNPRFTKTIPANSSAMLIYYSTLGSNTNGTGLLGGSQVVKIGDIQNTPIGSTKNYVTDQVDLLTTAGLALPSTGLQLCFEGGNDQKAMITIGEGGASAVKLDLDNAAARTAC